MKKQTSLLSGFILGVWLMTTGQSLAQETESPKPSRWEVGVDLLTLIDKNNFPAYSLFGRYNLTPDAPKSTYLRMRAGYQFETNLDSTQLFLDIREFEFEATSNSPFILLGIEREVLSFSNSYLYTGLDFYWSQASYKFDWGPNTLQSGYQYSKFQKYGSNIILGYAYKISNQIKLSFESSLLFQIDKFQIKEEVYFFDYEGNELGGKIRDDSSRQFNSLILPFNQLLLTLTF